MPRPRQRGESGRNDPNRTLGGGRKRAFSSRPKGSDWTREACYSGAPRKRPDRRAAERSDEFAPSKANPHLPLPCAMGRCLGRIARRSLRSKDPEPAPDPAWRARARQGGPGGRA
jgi:hypothetical protein